MPGIAVEGDMVTEKMHGTIKMLDVLDGILPTWPVDVFELFAALHPTAAHPAVYFGAAPHPRCSSGGE